MRLSAHATLFRDPHDTLTEIEVDSEGPVSDQGERSSFGEELGVLSPGILLIVCFRAVAHCNYSNTAGAWLLYGFSYQNTPS